MNSMNILEIKDLTKSFKAVTPLKDFNLEVKEGTVFGFLGQNGSGKTTTLRLITGLAKPTQGDIYICGEKVVFGGGNTNRNIGFLPDVPEFYNFLTPKEYLNLCGKLYGMNNSLISDRTTEMLKLVGLDGLSSKRRIQGFSRGMKQRLGIAQALIHRPRLLMLDEPTSALDPVGRKDILDIINTLKGELTVMFSTHILSDVERVCDTVGVLHGGKLALQGEMEALRTQYSSQCVSLEIVELGRVNELVEKLKHQKFVRKTQVKEDGSIQITSSELPKLYSNICPILSEMNLSIKHFQVTEPNLEEVFMEVIKK